MGDLEGKKILLGVSGSIAAYKSVYLLRALQKSGAEVRVIMTQKASDFVSPLSFEAISHYPVYWDTSSQQSWNNHIALSLWADAFIVAPATANTIAKFTTGMANDMVSACYLASRCPVYLAPSMDVDMWHHPATRSNINILQSRSVYIIPVGYGPLASGLTGEGRMAEPDEIVEFLKLNLLAKTSILKNKKVLITAGPTHEAIDPVRFIGNSSTGKMGIALAEALANLDAEVTLILGPTQLTPGNEKIKVIHVTSARDMLKATSKYHTKADVAIFSAAVADYRPGTISPEKIKKTPDEINLSLIKNPDIAYEMGRRKNKHQIHIGFALESTTGEEYAKEKLKKKKFDLVVLNSLTDPGAGFAGDTNKATFYFKNNKSKKFELKSKMEVAHDIIETIELLIKEKKEK
ncbi:MAG: bifunctional phosphopantothenoylcysteine decarboxylase/phosphopantothenate--cysteine ligase CoaBC [Saprospiraceae bacterium]